MQRPTACRTRRWPTRSSVGYPVSALLFVAGALLALYGLFALAFREGSGATYVKIAGRELDAHVAGGLSVAAATLLVVVGMALAGRGRSSGRSRP